MRIFVFTLAGACLSLFLCASAYGQTSSKSSSGHPQETRKDKEPVAILELGAATSWNISGGAATFAPNLAAEVTPIENWLELEAGVSPFYTSKSTEWDTDLLFKKPWTLSRKTEFMLGIGPEWVHLKQNGKTSNSIAGEAVGDFRGNAFPCEATRMESDIGLSAPQALGFVQKIPGLFTVLRNTPPVQRSIRAAARSS